MPDATMPLLLDTLNLLTGDPASPSEAVAVGVFRGRSPAQLHSRITMIAHYRSATARQWIAAVLVGMAVVATAAVWAAPPPPATRPTTAAAAGVPGLIVSVDGRTLAVRPLADLAAKPVSVSLGVATDVRIDGQPAKLEALRPGMTLDRVPLPVGTAAVSARTAASGLVVRVDGQTVFLQRLPPEQDRLELPPDGARATGPADMAFTADAATGVTLMGRAHFGHGWTQLRRGTFADPGLAASIGPGAFLTVMVDGGSGRAGDLMVMPYLPPDEVTIVAPPVLGTFERLDGDRLVLRTVARRDGVRRAAVTVAPSADVRIDGDPAHLADLRPGMDVQVRNVPGPKQRMIVSANEQPLRGRVSAVNDRSVVLSVATDGNAQKPVSIPVDERTVVQFLVVHYSRPDMQLPPGWRPGVHPVGDLRPDMNVMVFPADAGEGRPARKLWASPRPPTTAPTAPFPVPTGEFTRRESDANGLVAPPSAGAGPAVARGDGLRAKLDRRMPEVRFNANALSDVVDFLRDTTGANIYVDWQGLARIGVARDTPITVRVKDVKFSDALGLVCQAAGKDDAHRPVYAAMKGFIRIGPPAPARGRGPATRP